MPRVKFRQRAESMKWLVVGLAYIVIDLVQAARPRRRSLPSTSTSATPHPEGAGGLPLTNKRTISMRCATPKGVEAQRACVSVMRHVRNGVAARSPLMEADGRVRLYS